MSTYEEALKKQYEQQLQANKKSIESSIKQAESALPQYAQQRENGARQADVRLKQGETELKDRLAEAGINGGESETSLLKLQTQYGNEISALNEAYQSSAAQVQQQVDALRLQGEKQDADTRADYYGKLAQLTLQLQQAEAEAKAQAEEAAKAQAKAAASQSKTTVKSSAAAKTKEEAQEKIAQKRQQAAQKLATKQQTAAAYVTVDGVKMTQQELELRLKSGSVVQDDRGNYTFSYQRYPYWRKMLTK